MSQEVYINIIKPVIDFLLAAVLLAIFAPVILLIMLIQLVFYRFVFFNQSRIGKRGKNIKIHKFQTMCGEKGSESERITLLGKFLRKTSLDELPQLINVLKGQMSLVGPRPLLPEYLVLYSDKHKRRHDIKPGITGWAQVNGRNSISWQERLDLDIEYLHRASFAFDSKILLLTIFSLFSGRNNDDIMPRFEGYNK